MIRFDEPILLTYMGRRTTWRLPDGTIISRTYTFDWWKGIVSSDELWNVSSDFYTEEKSDPLAKLLILSEAKDE